MVCDLDRFEVHTNFTGTIKRVYDFTLATLDHPESLRVLRAVFENPDALKPSQTVESVTEAAAARFGALATSLHRRGFEPPRIAHFLVQLLFALFAEDVRLLPKGIVSHLLTFGAKNPDRFVAQATALFEAMRDGGDFALNEIAHFNGGLFALVDPLPLTGPELAELAKASDLDWGSVEPAIFGTLFERSLDPSKRAQLGAHYTGRADIERVVEPVVMVPLRRRWDEVRAQAAALKTQWDAATTRQTRDNRRAAFSSALFAFQEELASVTVLDPACGSGNFLYVALAALLDLEKEVVAYGTSNGLSGFFPRVGPRQLYGLEINEYAHELAQVVVWIGYLQWMSANGFPGNPDPILEALETIKLQDALLDLSDPAHPKEAHWPAVDFIIGNPPFLGAQKFRREFGDDYTKSLYGRFGDRIPGSSDFVCYFFEKARESIVRDLSVRVGLLANTTIRSGGSRKVLERIASTGSIFMGWTNERWVLEGADVRICIVGFDNGSEQTRVLDGFEASTISPGLSASMDLLSEVQSLVENLNLSFEGDKKAGPFEIDQNQAEAFLTAPLNPNGRPNSNVVVPWIHGADVVKRKQNLWIIDFGPDATEHEAALYEAPFEFIAKVVHPLRIENRDRWSKTNWWLHQRARPRMRAATLSLVRFIVTPRVAKHRIFVWAYRPTLPDSRLCVIAREDDYFFGVLHSKVHQTWSLHLAPPHGVGNDPTYNNTLCFETFPLPWAPGTEPVGDPRVIEIGAAAKELDDRRRVWLDPEGAAKADLKKRTLTNLYNQRPTWLVNAHARLDRAVWTAYGWDDPDPATVEEDVILSRLLALNLERAAAQVS